MTTELESQPMGAQVMEKCNGPPANASRLPTLLARIDFNRGALLTLRPPAGNAKNDGSVTE
jgi:hypothetical protein